MLVIGLLAHCSAAAQDSTLTRLVHQYRLPLTQQGTQLAGPGWDKLRQDIAKSQFVLVGEDHGAAQIPVFTTALAQEFKPTAYVAEIDKYQAQDLSNLAAEPTLPTTYMRQHPMGLSFYSWQEEFALAHFLRRQHVAIFGIDQVSQLSTGRFFERLGAEVKSPAAKAYLLGQAQAYQKQDLAAMQQGNGSFSIVQRPAALDSLRSLTRSENPKVRQMVEDFAQSAAIYQRQYAGKGGHQQRVNLMKSNLLQTLTAYQSRPGKPLPKLLFKLGAGHVGRSAGLLNGTTDVGSLMQNLADAQDAQSLHIYVMAQQGTLNNKLNPSDFSQNAIPYTVEDEPAVRPFLAPTHEAAWQVCDLRPLRRAYLRNELKIVSSDQVLLLLNFDYLVVVPTVSASHNY